MRSAGINWLAVIAAAIAVYAIGFIIYAVMMPMDLYLSLNGMTEAQQEIANARMAYSPLMPILTAVFMAVLFKWGQVSGAMNGAKWAMVIALASAIPTMLYGWVYGGLNSNMALVDSSHLLLGHIAAGAILGGWK